MGSRSPSQPGQTAGWFPGLRLGPQRAPGTPGRSGSGQPGSGRQTAWPQAQGQVAPQRSRVKATTGCVMCAAVPAASGTWDDTQSQTFVRGPGVHPAAPPGTPGAAGGARTGAGRPEEAGGSWPCSGLRPPGPVPLVQLQPGGGKAEGIPETGRAFAWAPAGHTATPCAEAVGPQSVAGTTPESPGRAERSRFPGTPRR